MLGAFHTNIHFSHHGNRPKMSMRSSGLFRIAGCCVMTCSMPTIIFNGPLRCLKLDVITLYCIQAWNSCSSRFPSWSVSIDLINRRFCSCCVSSCPFVKQQRRVLVLGSCGVYSCSFRSPSFIMLPSCVWRLPLSVSIASANPLADSTLSFLVCAVLLSWSNIHSNISRTSCIAPSRRPRLG